MGIAALILGIIGVLAPGFGILLSIAAVILGILAVKKKKQKGLGLGGIITGGVGIVLAPVLAAIAIPSFIQYQQGAKASETSIQLDQMYYGARTYMETPRYGPGGETLPAQLPPSVDWTPAVPCCQQSGGIGKCDPYSNEAAWQHPTWQALEFEVRDPFYYQYRFLNQGNQVLFQAQGDLDCDGETSLITLRGTIQPDGVLVRSVGLEKQNELE
ncbi:MAG: DUF4190 domain-containing protein [Deltaproteobacteria bacterium]|nr:DUF4190 domain-containing protein [Deltaproteobacteria bacterium]